MMWKDAPDVGVNVTETFTCCGRGILPSVEIPMTRFANCSAARRPLKVGPQDIILDPSSWAPDGSGLLVTSVIGGKGRILFLPLQSNGATGMPRELNGSSSAQGSARFSLDGKRIGFTSDEDGKYEVYDGPWGSDGRLGSTITIPVRTIPVNGNAGLGWASDHRLFFSAEGDKVMWVKIETTPSLSASVPAVAFDLKRLRVNPFQWDILPDGRLLAIQRGEGEDDITNINIVLNWSTERRRRMNRP